MWLVLWRLKERARIYASHVLSGWLIAEERDSVETTVRALRSQLSVNDSKVVSKFDPCILNVILPFGRVCVCVCVCSSLPPLPQTIVLLASPSLNVSAVLRGDAGSGITGSSGDAGSGITGSSGDAGSGITGSSGDAGPGITGSSGDAGSGITGSSGDAGSGITSSSGDTGSGITGSSGDAGSGISACSGTLLSSIPSFPGSSISAGQIETYLLFIFRSVVCGGG